jgi:hypothetical protein
MERKTKSLDFRMFVQSKYAEYCKECLCFGLCKTQLGLGRYFRKNKWFLKNLYAKRT